MDKCKALRIILAVLLLIAAIVVFVITYKVNLQPFQRGYFCDDDSIRYPYKDSTVSDAMLYGVGVAVGAVLIVINEIVYSLKAQSSMTENDLTSSVRRASYVLKNIRSYLYFFVFGLCITDITTNFMKITVGRLRPNFLDVCNPDFDCANATDPHMYVLNYTCDNTDNRKVMDSRLSFPSGHSSIATYAMLFSIVYLQRRMTYSNTLILRILFQWIMFLLGAFTCISRIEDNKHHATDVIAGILIGALSCFTMFCTLSRFVEEHPKAKEKESGLYSMRNIENGLN